MNKKYGKVFKTAPGETFSEFFDKRRPVIKESELLDEAVRVMQEYGYTVITEAALPKFIAGLALSLGLITNAMAKDWNAQCAGGYTSQKANTSMFNKNLQKDYNLESNVQLTDIMVQKIADSVAKKLYDRMTAENKYDEEDLVKLSEWHDATDFYKQLMRVDEGLGNSFSRRLDKALTKSLSITPNIQNYVNSGRG